MVTDAAQPDDQDRVTTTAAHRHLPAPEKVVAEALREAQHGGCGTSSLRARSNPDRQAELAVRALRLAGYTFMQPACEACDDDGISW